MKKILLSLLTLLFVVSVKAAENAKVSVSDMSLSVAEGEQIDEDGDFKVTFNYTGKVLDESVMAGMSFKISVYDAENKPVVENESYTCALSAGSKNVYVSNLEGGKEYTIKVVEVVVKDNSKIDYETIFQGEEILKITDGLPTLKFTPVAGEVKPVEVRGMTVTNDKNAVIDQDGNYMVAFNYAVKVNDANIKAENLSCAINYQVYDADFELATSGQCEFSASETSCNVPLADLVAGKSYTFMVSGLKVLDGETELLSLVAGLPKLTFKVKDPNGPQAITMSGLSLLVAPDEQIDEDGDFKVAFNYTATVNDASAVLAPYASVSYIVTDANGDKVTDGLKDFSCDATTKNLYISNLQAGNTYTVTATKIEIQDLVTMEMLCELDKGLPTVTFTVGDATAISRAEMNSVKSANKLIENGKIIIVGNGKKYGLNAIEVK